MIRILQVLRTEIEQEEERVCFSLFEIFIDAEMFYAFVFFSRCNVLIFVLLTNCLIELLS